LWITFVSNNASANPWAIDELRGRNAPVFTLNDLKGNTFRLSDYNGKVILLNFWATWCPPCREEIKSLERLYQKYKDNDLIIFAISLDRTPEKAKRFIKELAPSFPVLYDYNAMVSKKYNVFSIPTTFLIDKKGRIVDIFFGEHNWASKTLIQKIEGLF
jgi:peroxiredoxin